MARVTSSRDRSKRTASRRPTTSARRPIRQRESTAQVTRGSNGTGGTGSGAGRVTVSRDRRPPSGAGRRDNTRPTSPSSTGRSLPPEGGTRGSNPRARAEAGWARDRGAKAQLNRTTQILGRGLARMAGIDRQSVAERRASQAARGTKGEGVRAVGPGGGNPSQRPRLTGSNRQALPPGQRGGALARAGGNGSSALARRGPSAIRTSPGGRAVSTRIEPVRVGEVVRRPRGLNQANWGPPVDVRGPDPLPRSRALYPGEERRFDPNARRSTRVTSRGPNGSTGANRYAWVSNEPPGSLARNPNGQPTDTRIEPVRVRDATPRPRELPPAGGTTASRPSNTRVTQGRGGTNANSATSTRVTNSAQRTSTGSARVTGGARAALPPARTSAGTGARPSAGSSAARPRAGGTTNPAAAAARPGPLSLAGGVRGLLGKGSLLAGLGFQTAKVIDDINPNSYRNQAYAQREGRRAAQAAEAQVTRRRLDPQGPTPDTRDTKGGVRQGRMGPEMPTRIALAQPTTRTQRPAARPAPARQARQAAPAAQTPASALTIPTQPQTPSAPTQRPASPPAATSRPPAAVTASKPAPEAPRPQSEGSERDTGSGRGESRVADASVASVKNVGSSMSAAVESAGKSKAETSSPAPSGSQNAAPSPNRRLSIPTEDNRPIAGREEMLQRNIRRRKKREEN